MGRQKLLMEIEGKPMLERVIEAVRASNIEDIILVYNDDEINSLGDKHGIKTVYNPNPSDGQSSSIIYGVEASKKETKGYMFFVGDQPYLSSSIINRILEEFNKGLKTIVIPRYCKQQGNPVVFHSKYREDLVCIHGDIGGRKIIANHQHEVCYLDFDNAIHGKDIDTWEAYEEFKDSSSNNINQ